MKAVIQRVKGAKVEVGGKVVGEIAVGVLVFLGVSKTDTKNDADYLAQKIARLRIFEDDEGKMNRSAEEVSAQMLVVSQFTLYGDCRKGRRPSFDEAARGDDANVLYEYFVESLRLKRFKVETGEFAAMMDVSLVNDGPVTFILESAA